MGNDVSVETIVSGHVDVLLLLFAVKTLRA
jgi:hypothetical protein